MTDILFDTKTRDLVVQNRQILSTKDSSVQNGLIIRDAKGINVLNPTLGIGFNPINSQASLINYELNRWKKQCIDDGAKVAVFNPTTTGFPNSTVDINYYISY